MNDAFSADLDAYQRGIDKTASDNDAILCRAHQICRAYQLRGITIAWEICHQEAEREFDNQAEGPDREGE